MLVQAATVVILFPVLLKFDTRRRARHRMDVFCCLQQPISVAHHRNTADSAAQTPPSYLLSATTPNEGIVRVVETTSTKVRLSENSVATVQVSVATEELPSLFRDIQACGDVNVSYVSVT